MGFISEQDKLNAELKAIDHDLQLIEKELEEFYRSIRKGFRHQWSDLEERRFKLWNKKKKELEEKAVELILLRGDDEDR